MYTFGQTSMQAIRKPSVSFRHPDIKCICLGYYKEIVMGPRTVTPQYRINFSCPVNEK